MRKHSISFVLLTSICVVTACSQSPYDVVTDKVECIYPPGFQTVLLRYADDSKASTESFEEFEKSFAKKNKEVIKVLDREVKAWNKKYMLSLKYDKEREVGTEGLCFLPGGKFILINTVTNINPEIDGGSTQYILFDGPSSEGVPLGEIWMYEFSCNPNRVESGSLVLACMGIDSEPFERRIPL